MSKLSESQKQFVDVVAVWLKNQLDQCVKKSQSEIELRFGHMQSLEGNHKNNHFVNGVSVHEWHSVRQAFANIDVDAQSSPAQTVLEIVKVFESCHQKSTLRSIEHVDGTHTNQCKTQLAEKNFQLIDAFGHQMSVRLSHNLEEPHDIDYLHLTPVTIRARARTTFWHRMWRIDLSQVQQGADEVAVEMAPALFEIEVELLQDRIDWSKHDFHYVALSLLLKIGEILHFMRVPNSTASDLYPIKLPEIK